jgi:hypothetical protein
MLGWDASPELMEKIRASIKPVRTDQSLRLVLAEDFPSDCANLPIAGGWGYVRDDPIIFMRNEFPPIPPRPDFVSLEHHIAQKIIYEELIIFRQKGDRFSGINLKPFEQRLLEFQGRNYDNLHFAVTCWSDRHWEQLKREWEENDFGFFPKFDREAHSSKRDASQVTYNREFWFDITEVFSAPVTLLSQSSSSNLGVMP